RVDLDNNFSEDCDVKYGVPQRSCLGPILFLLYVSQLYDIIDRHLPSSHGYADDTQLYVSFRPDCEDNSENTLAILEDCISDVRTWLLSHKLMFKDSKTEFLVIGTPQQLLKINIESVNVGQNAVNDNVNVPPPDPENEYDENDARLDGLDPEEAGEQRYFEHGVDPAEADEQRQRQIPVPNKPARRPCHALARENAEALNAFLTRDLPVVTHQLQQTMELMNQLIQRQLNN
ncbi:Hypothetical predicted protein, partial [Paramuricea clavata]